MFDLIFNKDDSFFFGEKSSIQLGSTSRNGCQIQICNSSTRNPAIPAQLPNSKLPDCCHIGAILINPPSKHYMIFISIRQSIIISVKHTDEFIKFNYKYTVALILMIKNKI